MRSSVFAAASVAALCLTHAATGRCWGDDGHRIIGEIAAHYPTPRAAQRIESCLTEVEYGTLADAATWADVYARRIPSYAWASPLHYVNVHARAAGYAEARDCSSGCVVTAIRRFRAALVEPGEDLASRGRRQEALYFLAHFVGDIHQPLHVAHPDLRGGNSTEVSFFGEARRAHWVWDEGILARVLAQGAPNDDTAPRRTWADLAFDIRMRVTPAERKARQRDTNPEKWANESLALAKQYAYLKPREALGERYVTLTWSVVRAQLTKAGLRLAAVLNEAFP